MAVHAFTGGLTSYILLVVSFIICIAGFWLLISRWGHRSSLRFFSVWLNESFRDGVISFSRVLVFDILLFRRIWHRSKRRWAIHLIMFWGFIILTAFTILSIIGIIFGYIDPTGPGGNFSHYIAGFHLPYDLLGYFILVGSGIALGRRLIVKKVRERTNFSDFFLVGTVFVIALTGMMAEWFSGYATLVGPFIKNWNLALEFMSWHIYVAFLLFAMVIPWTKFRHIITVPLTLFSRRGGD